MMSMMISEMPMELGNGQAVGQVNLGLALRSRALELCWRQAGKWHGMSSDSSSVFTDHTLSHPLNCRGGVENYQTNVEK